MQGSPQSGLERHLQPSKQSPNRSGLAIDAPDLLVGSYKTGRMEETEAGEARGWTTIGDRAEIDFKKTIGLRRTAIRL